MKQPTAGKPAAKIIEISDLTVAVTRKDVKHLHLSVYPPLGDVRVTAPLRASDEKIRLFVISRLAWIRRKRREMTARDRPAPREYTEGESVYLWGKHYRIRIVVAGGKHRIKPQGEWLAFYVREGTDRAGRERLLRSHYRTELRQQLPAITAQLEKKTGLRAGEYRIKQMTTKWGSCTVAAKRIWINLELARHPAACLRYIVLHELLHLEERGHTQRFRTLLTQFMPGWRSARDLLNEGVVGVPEL